MADPGATPVAGSREILVPKLFSTLRSYDRAQFASDANAPPADATPPVA